MRKSYLLTVALVLAVAGGAAWLSDRSAALPEAVSLSARAQEATPSSTVALVPDMILGQSDAPVEVVEYASYTCPHCANFHDEVFARLKTDYIDTGKVKFVFREVYFDKFGLWASMVARCGGPEKYFGISDMIFETQRDWLAPGGDNPNGIVENLRKIGLKAGIDAGALDLCLKDSDMAKAMVAAYQEHAKADKIEGTPTFIINGQSYSGEMPYADFAKIIDEKLAN